MFSPNQQILLLDILKYARLIQKFTKNMSANDLLKDEVKLLAVIRCFEVVGEAAGRLNEESRKQLSEIPVQKMRGMRNQLIHDYNDISFNVIWKTIQEDVGVTIDCIYRNLPDDILRDFERENP